ncbi:hypothetical protein HMPREF1705_04759 [Acetomicrobium hydrogeniformans ATCC BAA-1850]|uniref:Uncharacterized protein n=1 Tax=Acetomicrobium hydrogeniformans ATCC BAA-1850 TaxID=592015 RepID=A0A0T5X9N9_9BACT|nr:hypothetical protein HMPREF1705_04759 [Acetomicrobium hydrogeniformans ATCC BAA-1850]
MLRGLAEEAVREILTLKQNPYLGNQLKGSLLGVRALEFSLESGLSGCLYSTGRR